ncbi:MAG: 16S rRNA (uracil(1498)-N(3))-methyltransferase [Cyclobacteriaceae bacterium]|nr:16S rRNA (uracil(1498)-N(3))-methyltransferase [Cyclobacteriaceae bacterium]
MENLFYQPDITQGADYLNPDEARHCTKVLRKKPGDVIMVTDGKGWFYNVLITASAIDRCTFAVQNSWKETPRNYSIHIAIAPTKSPDRIEWMVEKCVEIGVDEISFLHCANSERQNLKMERLQKIAISAMKQSIRATLPHLSPPVPFSVFINGINDSPQKFIGYVDSDNPIHLKQIALKDHRYLVLIGPEGDFSLSELTEAIDNGFQKVSLGNHRLRTETAGFTSCCILNLINT